tara:strand:+ start:597 stop:1445 length:849 start_codon:yes stop_codon:yes gene_type:complete
MSRALVLGANGQLGTDLILHSPETWEVVSHFRSDWDVTLGGGLEYLNDINPDVIINTTAFHNVDECEKNPDLAYSINRDAVEKLAMIAERIGAILVHISTDYVFGNVGDADQEPFYESSEPSPLNIYGKSKLEGEKRIRGILERHYIIRISSVFGKAGASGKGGNFVYTMLNLGRTKDELGVIDDIVMSPTYTVDAAKSIWRIITDGLDFGTYHCNNSGQCSWFEFTNEIMKIAEIGTLVKPVKHTEYPSLADKPLFSAMASEKGANGRKWQEALSDFIRSL